VAGTDGRFGRTRLFTCAPKKAFFSHLSRVRRDKRFAESSHLVGRTASEGGGRIYDYFV